MAKVSEVSICNRALALLGEKAIISLDDNSTPASLCKVLYPQLRDEITEAHNWTFATRWINLPKAEEPSDGPLQNRFPIPADVLRVIFVGIDPLHAEEYQVEEQDVVTNSQKCVVRVVVSVVDPTKFSTMFASALSAYLAAELAVPLVDSQSLSKSMYQSYGIKVSEAVTRDQIQGTSKRITSKWILKGRTSGSRLAGPTV